MSSTRRVSSGRVASDGLKTAGDFSGRVGGLGPERVLGIQRARILAGMVEVSAERGAASVSVAHIVERAGVSRRTFYDLYDDREECFLDAFDDVIARVSRHVFDVYDRQAGWVERVRSSLIAVLSFFETDLDAGQLLIVGSLGAGAKALERRRRVLAQIIAVIDEGRSETKGGAELPPLTAEGIVGGILSILHSRLLADSPASGDGVSSTVGTDRTEVSEEGSLLRLTSSLMSMIVLPYLGVAAARRELHRSMPAYTVRHKPVMADPLRDVHMRLTYRTVRVLTAVAELSVQGSHPSNREIGVASGVSDQGQISKLLTRLSKLGLIENSDAGLARGGPNAWMLTDKGIEIEQAIGQRAG